MASTTRSSGRRAVDTALPSTADTRTTKALVKKSTDKKSAIAVSLPARCTLLEVPAEIRNRIYSFCKEYDFVHDWDTPSPLRKSKKTARPLKRPAGRNFFKLVQTCKQIRAEYRPLWLRDSSVSLDFEDVAEYLATFHSLPGTRQLDVNHAPKMMRILWDHEKENYKTGNLLLNLKPLLNFRAVCKWFSVHFQSRRLAEGDFPHEECEACNQCINCRGRCERIDWRALLRGVPDFEQEDFDSLDLDEIFPIWDTCPHEGLLEEVEGELYAEYRYLEALNGFLDNKNEAWLKSVRDDLDHKRMKVECTMGPKYRFPTIYIRFDKGHAPPIFLTRALSYAVCQYLTDVGIIDLKERTALDFVIGVGVGKATQHSPSCTAPIPTYNQINIFGRTYKAPAGIIRAAQTGDGN